MKLLIETVGPFMLMDPYTGNQVEPNRPTVVTPSTFITERVSNGQIEVHSNRVSGEATDADFLAYWKEAPDMAIEAFLSEFASEGEKKAEEPTEPSEEEKFAALDEALAKLEEGDFQKDGKPKVGPLDKAASVKVDTELRDAFWAKRNPE